MDQNPVPPPDTWVYESWMGTPRSPSPPPSSPSPPPSSPSPPPPMEAPPAPAPAPAPPPAPAQKKQPWEVIEPFYKKYLSVLYSEAPATLTPPEGWDDYKHEKRGRRYGSIDLASNHDQLRMISRGVDFIGPVLPETSPLRSWFSFPQELTFSKEKLMNTKELSQKKPHLYQRTVLIKTNSAQRKMLDKWIRGSKFIYNTTLKSVQEKRMPLNLTALEKAFSSKQSKETAPDVPARKSPRVGDHVNYWELADEEEEEEEEEEESGHASGGPDKVKAQFGGGFLLGHYGKLADIPSVVTRSVAVSRNLSVARRRKRKTTWT